MRATSSGGIALKNSKNVRAATTQMTTIPLMIRRNRKRTVPTASARFAHSRVGRRQCHPSALTSADFAASKDALRPRVHRVADSVAEQVESQRGDQQRRRREDY